MLFAGISDTGRVRENNEDSYCLGELPVPGGWLLAVADGLGGLQGGEVASGIAVRTLRAYLWAEGGPDVSWREALRRGIVAAHRAIRAEAAADGALAGMATTLTAAVVAGGRLHWGHVGDSRAYLVRGGALAPLTRDHSVVAELLAAGRLAPEAARRDPRRHQLTQALGMEGEPEVETGELDLLPGDWVVLATDGLTAVVRDEEILRAAAASASAGAFCQTLVDLANARGGPDNITVLVGRA